MKTASSIIFSHGRGRREKTRGEQQDIHSVSNASLGSVLTHLSIGFLSSLYRSWCFALHWGSLMMGLIVSMSEILAVGEEFLA